MAGEIEKLLAENGPTLSSGIVERLCEKGVNPAAARQRISRTRGVKRLHDLQFPNRAAFLYLQEQFGTDSFKETLAAALRTTNSSYGRALSSLQSRGGALPESHFAIATGLPIKTAKGQILSSAVLSSLISHGLVKQTSTPDYNVLGLWDTPLISNRRRAALAVEDVVLGAVKTWLVHMGWTSSEAAKIRTLQKVPEFGQFQFDLVGPSYLNTLVGFQKGKLLNGFIVADILLDSHVSMRDLAGFFSKWEILTHQRRSTRFQPIFIGDTFEPDALERLRSKGCVVARPATIFGKDIAAQLRDLVGLIENAAAAVTNNPDSVFHLLKQINKIEGATLNLRGVVIELIVAHLYKLNGYWIDIRQQIASDKGERAEIDVKAVNNREVVCVECKGKSNGTVMEAEEIQHWADVSIPRIKKWLKLSETLPESRRFEFYCSTGYSNSALALIKEIEATHVKQPVRFYDGQDIIAKLREEKQNSLIDIFREQFCTK